MRVVDRVHFFRGFYTSPFRCWSFVFGSVGLRVSGSHDAFMVIAILGLISPGECCLWESICEYAIIQEHAICTGDGILI